MQESQATQSMLVERAQGWVGELLERSAQIEADRRVPQEVADRLAQEGFFRMLVPRALGGLQVDVWTMVQVLKALAQGDAATAWCVMTGATTGLMSAYLPQQGAQALWGEHPDAVVAGVFAPMGKAFAQEGGYRLSGRWPFASGCQNSRWCMGGALVFDGEEMRKTPEGSPLILSLFFPTEEAEVFDTWSVTGLCGTGSHDIGVKELFIPEERTASLFTQEPRSRETLYSFPLFGMLAMGITGVALGIARGALELYKRNVKKKKTPTGRSLASQEQTLLTVARGEAAVEAADALVQRTLEEVWAQAARDGAIDDEAKARVRMAALQATELCVQATDGVYHAGGGSSIYSKNPMQRHFRDIHTLTQHIMVSPRVYKTVGKVLLGQEVDTSQL